jgi:hypothetical protein
VRDYRPAAINAGFFCAQCHDRYFNSSKLRNNQDESTYCGMTGAVTTPAGATAVSAVDATYCLPFWFDTTGTVNDRWIWADSRPSGDEVFMYRHASGDVRAAVDGSATQSATAFTSIGRTCLTCHVSHGTAAVADTNAADGVDASSAVNVGLISTLNVGGSLHGGSVLLRMDGRTLCIRCHASAVNFTTVP